MNQLTFANISRIIERENKSTTYKFALLRSAIDIIQENSPYILLKGDVAEIPLGLMIEKWLIYYYPILESNLKIPQINGSTGKIAFHDQLVRITEHYQNKGGLSVFYNDLRSNGFDSEIVDSFITLAKQLKETITKMPMRYIGGSLNQGEYAIFKYFRNAKIKYAGKANLNWLIENFGTFSMPIEYYEAFKILGSFISGTDNFLFKWAEFSVKASGREVTTERAIHEILKSPITERDILISKGLYRNMLANLGEVFCVWTGKSLQNYDVDHVLPFAIYKNNDLWNLLPAKPSINNQKRDKIPSEDTLLKSKELIIYYWKQLYKQHNCSFLEQLQVSLLGHRKTSNWENEAFVQLINTSKYLIDTRGYSKWELVND